MAIRLTVTQDTTKGSAANLYLHITDFFRTKEGSSTRFTVQYFKDETKAQEVIVDNPNLPTIFTPDISTEVTAGTEKIEKIAYDKIGAALLAAGLAPESDETESWVAYS